jgi:hypothetical protein
MPFLLLTQKSGACSRNILMLTLYMGIQVTLHGDCKNLLTCACARAHTHTHVMHSTDPKFSQSDNMMWNKSHEYIKSTKHTIQSMSHTVLKRYTYSLYTVDNLIIRHFLT